jgi:hypothetical protein
VSISPVRLRMPADSQRTPAVLPTLLAEVTVPEDHYIDPTTSTPFPRTLTSPSGTLQLVGTGVRTVSFLAIKVYAVGFYVDQKALKDIKDGKVPGWKVRRKQFYDLGKAS